MKHRSILFATPLVALCHAAYAQELPEGRGRDVVATVCTGCHEARRFTAGGGYTPEGWQTVIAMMRNIGAPIPEDRLADVTEYLTVHYPEKPKPAAVVIPGPVEVSFKSWPVPTPGSRPHDPLATPDGMIWFSGQAANTLGRVDPKTGEVREFKIDQPLSGPHGLVDDAQGNIWFAANWAGYIGKFDPRSGAFTHYPMPDAKARDPHTPLFAADGSLWFTLQTANMIGRLDTKSGEIKLVGMPLPRAQPYGMVFDSKGVPFFDEFGANRLASIDPVTMQVREYVLPHADTRPRRIAITSDDVLWYTDYSRGYLGRFDPATGKTTGYPSPSGRRTFPYGITALDDVIWYVEGGSKPNLLVRFDPKSESFQSWAIPTGGGVVRNMMPTRDRKGLVIAESGVNRIGLVEIK